MQVRLDSGGSRVWSADGQHGMLQSRRPKDSCGSDSGDIVLHQDNQPADVQLHGMCNTCAEMQLFRLAYIHQGSRALHARAEWGVMVCNVTFPSRSCGRDAH